MLIDLKSAKRDRDKPKCLAIYRLVVKMHKRNLTLQRYMHRRMRAHALYVCTLGRLETEQFVLTRVFENA